IVARAEQRAIRLEGVRSGSRRARWKRVAWLACAACAAFALGIACTTYDSTDAPTAPDGGGDADAPTVEGGDAAPAESGDGGADADAGPRSYAATVLSDSPRAYYRLGEPLGAAHDLAGSGVSGSYGMNVGQGALGLIAGDPDFAPSFPGG